MIPPNPATVAAQRVQVSAEPPAAVTPPTDKRKKEVTDVNRALTDKVTEHWPISKTQPKAWNPAKTDPNFAVQKKGESNPWGSIIQDTKQVMKDHIEQKQKEKAEAAKQSSEGKKEEEPKSVFEMVSAVKAEDKAKTAEPAKAASPAPVSAQAPVPAKAPVAAPVAPAAPTQAKTTPAPSPAAKPVAAAALHQTSQPTKQIAEKPKEVKKEVSEKPKEKKTHKVPKFVNTSQKSS